MSEPSLDERVAEVAAPVLEHIEDLAREAPRRVGEMLQVIREHLFDPGLQVTQLGRVQSRGERAIQFHKFVGSSLRDFVEEARLSVAERLLASNAAPVGKIADRLGFPSRSAFYRSFAKRFGGSPKELAAPRTPPSRPATTPLLGPLLEVDTEDLGRAEAAAFASWVARAAMALPEDHGPAAVREVAASTPVVIEALSEQSRLAGRADRARGLRLAELALANVEGSAAKLGTAAAPWRTRCLARLANAHRLANDHAVAERTLRKAGRALVEVEAESRPAVEGELLLNRGSLRRFQRRFTEARADLHRAAARCRATGQRRLEAQAWVQLGAVFFHQDDLEGAVAPLLSARQIVEADFPDDLHLRLLLLAQLACVEAERGHSAEALRVLPEARRLAAALEHRTAECQLDWIEAVARSKEGDAVAVERLLLRARQGFLALRDVDHTAIVALDLALLYEEQGKTVEIVTLAAEALPVLEGLAVPEAAEALSILRRAIDKDSLPGEFLRQLRALLSRIAAFS